MAKGGKIQALTDAVNALERELVKTKTQVEIFDGTVKDEAGRVEAAKNGVTEVSVVLHERHCAKVVAVERDRREACFDVKTSRRFCRVQSCS